MSTSPQIPQAPFAGMRREQPCPGAIVIGTNYRALGLVRSLGRQGIPVWVLKQDAHMLATLSRYAHRSLPWPDGDDNNKTSYLISLAKRYHLQGALLFPTDDEATVFIAQNHDLLSQHFTLTTPPWNSLQWAADKRLLFQLAKQLEIHQPKTFFPRNRADLLAAQYPFPVIVKPAMRIGCNQLTTDKAWKVEDRESLANRYVEACNLLPADLVMIQEYLPGWGEAHYSYVALCQDGKPVVFLTARRIRQFPMDFGRFSTFVEIVDEPGIVSPAARLLGSLRYTGIVEIEFKRDHRDGNFKLLDVNTRVWGWHTLCGRAGVDFPYLLWLLLQGKPLPDVRAIPGTRWIRMGADLVTVLLEVRRGRLPLRDYLRSFQGPLEWAIFAPDDPLPFFCQFPALAYLLAKRTLTAKSPKNLRPVTMEVQ
jgi:D-aspartate ligase